MIAYLSLLVVIVHLFHLVIAHLSLLVVIALVVSLGSDDLHLLHLLIQFHHHQVIAENHQEHFVTNNILTLPVLVQYTVQCTPVRV